MVGEDCWTFDQKYYLYVVITGVGVLSADEFCNSNSQYCD